MNQAVEDELVSINSIYGDETLSLEDADKLLCTLRFPTYTGVTLRLEFPEDYPNSPPVISGTQSVGSDVPKGAGQYVVTTAREVLGRIFIPGEPCIYDLVEDAGGLLGNRSQQMSTKDPQIDVESNHTKQPNSLTLLTTSPQWTIADTITEKKSIFVARCCSVESPEVAKAYIAHLLATDKKVAKATHNISAWRIHGNTEGTSYQDCDDDGESAAGSRMLHLMQLMDVWNVMVVVTRWYGGVHLGPDRFRIINNAAREVLDLAGYAKKGKK